MDNEELKKHQEEERQKYLAEAMKRAGAFEEWVNQASFKYFKARYENQIRDFSNKAIKQGFADMNEYQLERGKVLGIASVFDEVNSSLDLLKSEREKNVKS
jgi:flagellar biosynthesis/type III secretory pathway protein FliH